MKTELRVYHTKQRLEHDFNKLATEIVSLYPEVTVIKGREIIIPNVTRMVFVLDAFQKVAGYRPERVFIDEMVDPEIRDYVMSQKGAFKT